MRLNYKRIGDYIRLVDERNYGLKIKNLLGLSISKQFIPSVANIIGTDMENYKIIRKNQFACSTMQVRRDKKMPVALLQDFEEAIISPAYPIFEIKNTDELLPEYLMMWFKRQEFDREACYYAIGGVRGSLEWDDFCDMKLPIPNIEKQREIVKEYQTIINRIVLNNRLIQKLEETTHAVYKQWFVDFEFPDEAGKPYKSNGGEMQISKLGEIPESWSLGCLGDLIELQRGFELPSQSRVDGKYPIYAATGLFGMHNEFKVEGPGIVTGRNGSLGEVFYIQENYWPLNTTLWVKKFKKSSPLHAYYVLKSINIKDYNNGSATPVVNRNDIYKHELLIPKMDTINKFEVISKVLFGRVKIITNELNSLNSLKQILLSKLATLEDLVPKEELANI